MGKAFLTVDAAFVRDLLHLPADCEILTSVEGKRGTIRVLVDHPTIADGCIDVTATFKREEVIVFAGFEPVPQRPPAPPVDHQE